MPQKTRKLIVLTHNSSVCISYGKANEAKRKIFLNSMIVNMYIFKC